MALPPPSKASAPGKLILFGEHAVVYGHDALAVALSDLRVPAQVQLTPERSLTLCFPDTEPAAAAAVGPGSSSSSSSSSARLTFSWPLAELRASALRASLAAAAAPSGAAPPASGGGRAPPRALPPTPAVQAALAELVQALPSAAHRRACTPLLFLACAILAPRLLGEEEEEQEAAAADGAGEGGATLTVLPPSLPIGAGLGSSAAVSTACAAALLHAHGRLPAPLDAAALAAVNAWAYSAETLFHGAPSGLDNTVATFGGALLYARGGSGGSSGSGAAAFRQLRLASQPLRLLLVNTRVPKDTAALVAGVGALRAALPAVVAPLLQCIGAVVAEARAALEGSSSSSSSSSAGAGAGAAPEDLHAALSRLARINHSALNALGVGHAALDAVVAAAAQRGLAAKLTGAGGGGCAYVLLRAEGAGGEAAAQEEQGLQAALAALGFHCFTTRVGGQGVAIE